MVYNFMTSRWQYIHWQEQQLGFCDAIGVHFIFIVHIILVFSPKVQAPLHLQSGVSLNQCYLVWTCEGVTSYADMLSQIFFSISAKPHWFIIVN